MIPGETYCGTVHLNAAAVESRHGRGILLKDYCHGRGQLDRA